MPTLIIQLPGLPPVEHLVREDAITLGRMQGNSLTLNDASVSLSHAKITRVGNSFYIKDLNSTNGTTLNGQSIAEARLRDGDQLELGKVTACFRQEPLASPALLLPVKPMEPTLLPPLPPSRTRWQGRRWRVLAGLAGLTLLGLWIVKEVPILSTSPDPVALAPDPRLEALEKALQSTDAAVRRQAAAGIYHLGTAPVPASLRLTAALADSDPDVRLWVALALANHRVYDRAAVPVLVQALRRETPTLRQAACLSLAMMPCTDADRKTVIPALTDIAAADTTDPVTAQDAALALKLIAPERGSRR